MRENLDIFTAVADLHTTVHDVEVDEGVQVVMGTDEMLPF